MVAYSLALLAVLSLALLVVLGLGASSEASIRMKRRGIYRMLGVPPPPTDSPLPPDQWFSQLLDHFEPTSTETWQQRYQSREDLFKEGGPVFLQLEGEGPADARWMVNGSWVNYAQQYNALMFQLEHRFYGESHPTPDLSVANLRYLSSEQALADLAYFITAMNAKHRLPAGTKWVVFGGSYAGNLAAWARAKYPHLVHAAVSSSGPLLAKLDFYEYMEVVRDSLSTHSEACATAVYTADQHINLLLKRPLGRRKITKKFHLCEPIDANNNNDVANLLYLLAANIALMVQYNYQFYDQANSSSHSTIEVLCDIMLNTSIGTPVDRYAAINSFNYGQNGTCLNYSYNKRIQTCKNVSLKYNVRQWIYQTCTEFGFFQTAENSKKLFGQDFSLNFYVQQCRDIFGEEFTAQLAEAGVARTNIVYGALDIKATRIVYVHGSIDPWHALGITRTRVAESPAIFINGTSHCANMNPPSDSDLPALKAAREEISRLIGQWLQQS